MTGRVDTLSFTFQGTTPMISVVKANGLDHTVNYDNAGNETGYLATRIYSPRNLMNSVIDTSGEGPAHAISYAYDYRGARVSRTESSTDAGSANRYYFYTPELQLLSSTVDDSNNVWGQSMHHILSAPLAMNREIIWFDGSPVAEIGLPPRTLDDTTIYSRHRTFDIGTATNTFYTFTDHLGTRFIQTDTTGAIAWRAEYEPYGNVYLMRKASRTDQPLRFPGQELAMSWEGAEENYNVFRWYQAGGGRYTQADPLAFGAGSLNLYSYVGANPALAIDPFGLVTVQTTPLPTQIVDNDTLRKRVYPSGIGGQNLFGALYAGRSVDCDCQCFGGYWRAKVTIRLAYQIWASTCPNCPKWPTVTQIINEEEKHVGELLDSTKNLIGQAQNVESLSYPAKFLCKIDCWGLKMESAFTKWLPGFLEKLPGLNPHPHP